MNTPATITILLAMKRPGNAQAMRQALDRLGYDLTAVPSAAALQTALAKTQSARLAVVDITDFGADVWRLCACLRERNIPFIVLSVPQVRHLGNRLLAYGATSVLDKPVAKSVLLHMIVGLATQCSDSCHEQLRPRRRNLA